MLQIAICDDEVTNILKVKELAELFFRTHCVETVSYTHLTLPTKA